MNRPSDASEDAKSIAPNTYIAGRGTIDETNQSVPPTSTISLRPRASSGRTAASTSSAGVAALPTTRERPGSSPPMAVTYATGRSSRTASATRATSSGSSGSMKMLTLPPQGSPTSKASSSA